MTSGQERAVRELNRLQAADPSGFELVVPPVEADGVGPVIAVVGLHIGHVETAPGGLELRDREEFVLLIPPDFPFRYPSLTVAHDRFGGFPHVVWTHGICLYRSPNDWNPRDGLYGFFDKLRHWLWKAAINDMDPADAPLEPPHAVTDYTQPPFVVRADVPEVSGKFWLGFAQLEKYPSRTELVGWYGPEAEWPAGKKPALAVMLSDPFPMEFPKKGADFFRALEKQCVDRGMVLRLLALAAGLVEDGEPIHLIVGLPMRRGADGTTRTHIAVWTTPADFAKGLRLSLPKETDTESLQEVRAEVGDIVYNALAESEIVWCRVLEDRPEIVVRRDRDSDVSWFRGKRILLLGCGALGSWIGEILARAGTAAIDPLDKGLVKPGLLARQNYRLQDIGSNKAKALSVRLKSIARVTCEAIPREAHAYLADNPSRINQYDVVIDCTASSVFQMQLERDWNRFGGNTPPVISLALDALAERLLAVTLPPNSAGGIWDAYLQLKRRLCPAVPADPLIDAFYSDASSLLLQPEPGCSDPTFVGSTADVSVVASAGLNLSVREFTRLDVPCGIAYTPKLDGSRGAGLHRIPLTKLIEVRVGRYRVRLDEQVFERAAGFVGENNKARSSKHETGGLLWGHWDDAVEVIWIFDASGPPPDSKHDAGHFVCGVKGTAKEHRKRLAKSRGACGFVGMWHTHPDMRPVQSGTDIAGMAGMVAGSGQNQRRALMLIFGREKGRAAAGVYVYESQGAGPVGELVTVESGAMELATKVV